MVISDAQSLEGVYEAIALLGELTGREEAAEALAQEMRSGFDAIRQQAQTIEKTVYFEVLSPGVGPVDQWKGHLPG